MVDFSNKVYSIRKSMNVIRKGLSTKDEWTNNYLTRGRMLDYAEKYCHAVAKLKESFLKIKIKSQGISEFSSYINLYYQTESYQNLTTTVNHLREEFSNLEYNMFITEGTIKVRKYEGQKDYSKKILSTFKKFRQEDAKDYRHNLSEEPTADHVESAVLNLLSKLYSDKFKQLLSFSSEFIHFDDETIFDSPMKYNFI